MLMVGIAVLWRFRAPRPPALIHGLAQRWSHQALPRSLLGRHGSWGLQLAAAALMAVSLAGPQRTRQETLREVEGRDLALILDRSSSMGQVDRGFPESRWQSARSALVELVRRRTSDRLSLITFRRSATLHCPPTFDQDALAATLSSLSPGPVGDEEDRTALGVALTLGARLWKDQSDRSRVLLVISDGENNQNDILPEQAAMLCRDLGIRVHGLVVGDSEGASRNMSALAAVTGGSHWTVTDASSLARLADRLDALEPTRFVERRATMRQGLHHWPAWAALVVWAISCVLDFLCWKRWP